MMFYLIVGVDQDGDACWDVTTTYADAVASAMQFNETAHEPTAINRIMFVGEKIVAAKMEYPR